MIYMNKNTILLLVLLTSVCYSQQANGQISIETQSKNVIYANVGTFGLWVTASTNYERHLFSTDNKFHLNYYMRTCAGVFETWAIEGPHGVLNLQVIYGAKKSHL